jgi:hypothetical protein
LPCETLPTGDDDHPSLPVALSDRSAPAQGVFTQGQLSVRASLVEQLALDEP